MPVQNIECQLAQGQINRYLAGDTLSEAALQQLEAHVGECADCKTFLYEKRSSLFSILGHAAPEQPAEPIAVDDPSPKAKSLISAIRAKKPAPQTESEPGTMPTHAVIEVDSDVVPQTPKVFAKPLLYSAGLALVLIFMSTVMRDPTRFLGGTLNETLPSGKTAATQPVSTAQPRSATVSATTAAPTTTTLASSSGETTASKPAAPEGAPSKPATNPDSSAQPVPTSKPETQAPAPQPAPAPAKPAATTTSATPTRTPVREQARPAEPRTTRRVNRTRSNPRSDAPRPTQPPRPSGIRLYDANGNPINP